MKGVKNCECNECDKKRAVESILDDLMEFIFDKHDCESNDGNDLEQVKKIIKLLN